MFGSAQLITQWQVAANESVGLPISHSGAEIDWGDGTNSTSNGFFLVHVYPRASLVNISIAKWSSMAFNYNCSSSLKKIISWGDLIALENAFAGCSGLEEIPSVEQPSFRGSLAGFFAGCSNLIRGNIDWNLGSGSFRLTRMFMGATKMNFPVNFRGMENVHDMSSMFENANSFSQSFNYSSATSVTDVNRMFFNAVSFKQNLSAWYINASNCTYFCDACGLPDFARDCRPCGETDVADTLQGRVCVYGLRFCVDSPVFNCISDISGMYTFGGTFDKKAFWNHTTQPITLRWSTDFTQWVFDNDMDNSQTIAWINAPSGSTAPSLAIAEAWRYGQACGIERDLTPVPRVNSCPFVDPVIGSRGVPSYCIKAENFSCRQNFNISGNYFYAGTLGAMRKSYWKHSNQNMYLYWATRWNQWVFDNDTDSFVSVAFTDNTTLDSTAPAFLNSTVWKYGTTCGRNQEVVPSVTLCPAPRVRVPISNTTTTFNISNGVRVTIPGEIGNGTVEVTVNQSTPRTVSSVVTIVFFDPSDQERNVSNLSTPVRFVLPLLPAALNPLQLCSEEEPVLVVPACNWFDTVSQHWTTRGCRSNLSKTEVECSCTHLTDFAAVFPLGNQVPLPRLLQIDSTNISRYPGGLITVSVVLALFIVSLMFSIRHDMHARSMEDEMKLKKVEKWKQAESNFWRLTTGKRIWKQFKAGLQTRHTWASLFFRKSGTSFRSVDRAVVNLFLVLILMSLSAQFHDRDQSFKKKGVVMIYSLLASLLPSLLLIHLFTHTGEMGFQEKYLLENKLKLPSRVSCVNWRFPERWRYVWYLMVLVISGFLIEFILRIALVFDQNPYYYCRGETTKAWLVDFIVPYILSVCVVEPLKILCLVVTRQLAALPTTALAATEVTVDDRQGSTSN